MSLTTIDPNTALVVIDLQKGIVAYAGADAVAGVLKSSGSLADAFRRHGLPVVLVHVAGGAPGRTEQPSNMGTPPADWLDFAPELNQQPTDHTVVKRTWGAFTQTGLEDYLKNLGVTQIVIAGVSTSVGVESTARSAYEAGFNVTLAVDAMTDTNPEAHLHSITRIFPKLGETGSTREVIELLDSRNEPV